MLELVGKHPSNEHWWEVRNEEGEVGFVPSSYVLIKEDQVTEIWVEVWYDVCRYVWLPFLATFGTPVTSQKRLKRDTVSHSCQKWRTSVLGYSVAKYGKYMNLFI